jgi:cell volume regulation protein A
MFGTAFILQSAYDVPLLHGLILGAILGGTSSAIVIPLLLKMKTQEKARVVLTLESIITDVLVVIVVVVLVDVVRLKESIQFSDILNKLAGSFAIAMFLGLSAGLIWVKALARIRLTPFSYMTTLAVVLLLYAISELAKANGAVGVFTFGVTLRNASRFFRIFDIELPFQLDDKISSFHQEFSFFIRTYFFVYLGILVVPESMGGPVFFKALAIFAVLLLARYLGVWLVCISNGPLLVERFTLVAMLPRGLAAAITASIPASMQIPQTSEFIPITLWVILLSNLAVTVGVLIVERTRKTGATILEEQDN